MSATRKVFSLLLVFLVLFVAGFCYFRYFFVYSEGVNEGDINYFQREGFIFKTYEGKMIQTGYNSRNVSGTIQSNEFRFSVSDKRVAKDLENRTSRQVKLHWHRHFGTLPWRGNSVFIVDSVISIGNVYEEADFLDIPTVNN